MTEAELKDELKLLEKCDIESHRSMTDRIRVIDNDKNWNNSSIEYFNNSLCTEDKVLLKNFIHCDTYCRLGTIPQIWRVQGFICLGDMLDYVEQMYKEKEFRMQAFKDLYDRIVFDRQYDDYLAIQYKGKTYIKIIEYDAIHRAL